MVGRVKNKYPAMNIFQTTFNAEKVRFSCGDLKDYNFIIDDKNILIEAIII